MSRSGSFRAWLAAHHGTETELIVGFDKKASGRPSITWPSPWTRRSVSAGFDGVRRSVSEEAYCIRFTPRKPTSIWSAINVARVAELEKVGKLTDAGRRAFAARKPERTGVYSFERNEAATLPPADERRLRDNAAAAAFFDAQPPWYRRTAAHWIISAKREETRQRRLDQLIAVHRAGRVHRFGVHAQAQDEEGEFPPRALAVTRCRRLPGSLDRALRI